MCLRTLGSSSRSSPTWPPTRATRCPTGGKLTLAVSVSAGEVLLRATDSGVGMSDEVKARVFEPFYTTKAVGTRHRTGLATSRSIIDQAREPWSCNRPAGERDHLHHPVAADDGKTCPARPGPVAPRRRSGSPGRCCWWRMIPRFGGWRPGRPCGLRASRCSRPRTAASGWSGQGLVQRRAAS